jgi:hypothetical protein
MRIMRTRVASRRMAAAMARPKTLRMRRSPRTKAAKTQTMMAAAEVMTLPVEARPLATASESLLPLRHASLIREIRNTW